jgi:hypothetical protein
VSQRERKRLHAGAAAEPDRGVTMQTRSLPVRPAGRGTSRFPRNQLPHMPGSSTTPGPPGARAYAPVCIAFRLRNGVSTRNMNLCGAQWLAYALPYRRFVGVFTDANARLGADVDRSGRTEARTGLRMMPTSPRSPLSFRTAGFPRYGWKAGLSDGAFPIHRPT